MEFLLITQNYPPNKGGMATSCDRLTRNFRKNGVAIHIVHFTNRKKKFQTQKLANGSYSSIPIENSEEFTLSLASEFILQLPFINNVTHIAAFGGNLPLNLTPMVAKWKQIPLITFIRGNDFDEGIFSKRREHLLYALNNSSYVFTVTTEKQEKITNLVDHNNTYFTPNGINTDLWKPSKSHGNGISELKNSFNNKIPIAIIGQLKAKKGILNFAETFAKFPYKDAYVLCLIGEVKEEIKEAISTLNIHTKFYPFSNQNELLLFYNAIDIVAIPSFYDGMPNVLLEAGATKNIVIGANIGGIKDVIINTNEGFLYNPLQPNELLDILLLLHKMPLSEKAKIKENLYQKIYTEYTEQNEIYNYLKILNYEKSTNSILT